MPLAWTKVLISDERYESAGVFDVDNDGVLDIVSGGYWYQGPDFKRYHKIADLPSFGDYYDDFSTIPLDVDGDGYTDFITGGWWGNTLRWRHNPGPAGGQWTEHVIAETGNIESTRAWDVDGDGELEIVPNTPGAPLVVYKLVEPGQFASYRIWDKPQGHGLGCGDLTGNGRMDFVLAGGWLEAPNDPWHGEWTFHPDFDLGGASVPILVADVNGDGLADIIVGQGHGYGLDWLEQRLDGDGRRTWIRHAIDPYNSQYHDMRWADIDGDGQCELVTGKRYRAHPRMDPGDFDDVGIYYFKWTGESFIKQVIDYGPVRQATGCGIYFDLADLRGTGRLDVIAPGKDGLYVFFNEGQFPQP
ncbi:MAG: VCBS repeat-containing protein [Armatimonadetes bacterium]|nr:VCBS repeat-containing protein [Armatimonadota bacterium]